MMFSGGHQQNTDPRRIAQIYYLLHPLVGHRFPIRERRAGAVPSYYVETEAGAGLSIPVWMTEPEAATVQREEIPRVHVRALLELGALLQRELESLSRPEKNLRSNQAKEISDGNRTTPTSIDTGSGTENPAPCPPGSQPEHRAYRANACGRGSGKPSRWAQRGGLR